MKSLIRNYKYIFFIYTLTLIYLMLFGFGRTADDFKQIQLIPFQTIGNFIFLQNGWYDFMINIVCNILLFIPFGFLGLIFPKLKSLKWNLISFWIALIFIEFIQYITGRGTADVDDFILNSIGVILGNYLLKSKSFQNLIPKNHST